MEETIPNRSNNLASLSTALENGEVNGSEENLSYVQRLLNSGTFNYESPRSRHRRNTPQLRRIEENLHDRKFYRSIPKNELKKLLEEGEVIPDNIRFLHNVPKTLKTEIAKTVEDIKIANQKAEWSANQWRINFKSETQSALAALTLQETNLRNAVTQSDSRIQALNQTLTTLNEKFDESTTVYNTDKANIAKYLTDYLAKNLKDKNDAYAAAATANSNATTQATSAKNSAKITIKKLIDVKDEEVARGITNWAETTESTADWNQGIATENNDLTINI